LAKKKKIKKTGTGVPRKNVNTQMAWQGDSEEVADFCIQWGLDLDCEEVMHALNQVGKQTENVNQYNIQSGSYQSGRE
jgi:hypothetical protein